MPLPRPVHLASALVALSALLGSALGAARVDAAPATFTGADGLSYQAAPQIVTGREGYLFLGNDLDFACGLGARMSASMAAYAKLAAVIRKSGRRVVLTVAPNKSAVLPAELPTPTPHGVCDLQGVAAQERLLTSTANPDFLPLVGALRRSPRQSYYRTDQHWTTVGGAVFAKALATHLSPALGKRQRYSYGSESRQGQLALAAGDNAPEIAPTASPAGHVSVRTARGGPDWGGYPEFTFEHAWDSKPARKTWPGRTLLLGDSFMWFALQNLRPIFRHGHFVWIDHTGTDLVQAIKASDTVVIEQLQLFLGSSTILTPAFRAAVKRGLSR